MEGFSVNEKLVRVYLEGILKGFISFDDRRMQLANGVTDVYIGSLIDAEEETYSRQILDDIKTRKLKEFRKAVELAESPLAKAMK